MTERWTAEHVDMPSRKVTVGREHINDLKARIGDGEEPSTSGVFQIGAWKFTPQALENLRIGDYVIIQFQYGSNREPRKAVAKIIYVGLMLHTVEIPSLDNSFLSITKEQVLEIVR